MVWIRLFLAFAQVGILGYGGGPGSIGLIESTALRYGFVSTAQFQEMLAVAYALPGPIATKLAGVIGFKTAGLIGLASAVLGIFLPSLVLMLALYGFFLRFKDTPVGSGMFAGVAPAVIAILVVLVVELIPTSMHHWVQWVFLVGALVALKFLRIPAPLVILASLVGGALFLRS